MRSDTNPYAIHAAEDTAASFLVEWHTTHYVGKFSGGHLPVIKRYEFKLQRRQANGPMMFARITRGLDPAYLETRKFRGESEYMQDILVRRATRACEYKSFSAMRVMKLSDMMLERIVHQSVLDEGDRLLSFVRTNPDGTEAVEAADEWTRFPATVLAELRQKLQTVFGSEFKIVNTL
jgi:hypothetical protein